MERLFERLLDLRFLSIEFLNTFLITYRIFTDAETVLSVLENFYNERSRSTSGPVSNGDVLRLPAARRTLSLNDRRTERGNIETLRIGARLVLTFMTNHKREKGNHKRKRETLYRI